MFVNQTNKIVWLVDTIKRAGKISFHDLNELWKENECLGAGTVLFVRPCRADVIVTQGGDLFRLRLAADRADVFRISVLRAGGTLLVYHNVRYVMTFKHRIYRVAESALRTVGGYCLELVIITHIFLDIAVKILCITYACKFYVRAGFLR